jgi:hypothetical protein
MTSYTLSVCALDRAYDALNQAANALTVAMLTSPSSALGMDACILAEAIEREAAAVAAAIVRATNGGR